MENLKSLFPLIPPSWKAMIFWYFHGVKFLPHQKEYHFSELFISWFRSYLETLWRLPLPPVNGEFGFMGLIKIWPPPLLKISDFTVCCDALSISDVCPIHSLMWTQQSNENRQALNNKWIHSEIKKKKKPKWWCENWDINRYVLHPYLAKTLEEHSTVSLPWLQHTC